MASLGLAAGGVGAVQEHVDPALDGLRSDDGVGRAVQRHARAEPAQAPERVARRGGAGELLDQRLSEALLGLGRQSLQAGGAAPHLGELVRLGLGPAGFLGGARALHGHQERSDPAIDLVVVLAAQAGRHPPPENPPLGPALDVFLNLTPWWKTGQRALRRISSSG